MLVAAADRSEPFFALVRMFKSITKRERQRPDDQSSIKIADNTRKKYISVVTTRKNSSVMARSLNAMRQLKELEAGRIVPGDLERLQRLIQLSIVLDEIKDCLKYHQEWHDGGEVISGQQLDHEKVVVDTLSSYLAQLKKKDHTKQRNDIKLRQQHKNVTRLIDDCDRLERRQDELQHDQPSSVRYSSGEELGPEQKQKLTMENDRLYFGMLAVSDEIDMIRTQVDEISVLQTNLTDNIVSQNHMIEKIHTTNESAFLDIVAANKYLRNVVEGKTTGLYAFIFFVLSFSLLFLNWYNT